MLQKNPQIGKNMKTLKKHHQIIICVKYILFFSGGKFSMLVGDKT